MKNYNKRNFLEMLKYIFFAHGGSALIYIFMFSSAEAQYADKGQTDALNAVFLLISVATFLISATLMLTSHFSNSEKKMNFLNATYELESNEKKIALPIALKEGLTIALADLVFQLPMIIIFYIVGYRFGAASIFETLYICDVGAYIFFGNSIIGALVIASSYFLVYSLGVFLVICPMWNLGRIRKEGAPTVPDAPQHDAYYRNTIKNTYKIFFVLKKLITANLISFGIYLAFSVFFIAMEKTMSPQAAPFLYGGFYAVVFYCVHGFRRDGSYFPHEKKFSPVKETVAFFSQELIYYIISLSVFALIAEVSLIITGKGNIVTALLMFLFPFCRTVSIPVLRSVISLVWSCAVVLVSAVFRSYIGHRKISRASKYRR